MNPEQKEVFEAYINGSKTDAATHENLDNMKWLKANECPWNSTTFDAAAKNGNPENIRWLNENLV